MARLPQSFQQMTESIAKMHSADTFCILGYLFRVICLGQFVKDNRNVFKKFDIFPESTEITAEFVEKMPKQTGVKPFGLTPEIYGIRPPD